MSIPDRKSRENAADRSPDKEQRATSLSYLLPPKLPWIYVRLPHKLTHVWEHICVGLPYGSSDRFLRPGRRRRRDSTLHIWSVVALFRKSRAINYSLRNADGSSKEMPSILASVRFRCYLKGLVLRPRVNVSVRFLANIPKIWNKWRVQSFDVGKYGGS